MTGRPLDHESPHRLMDLRLQLESDFQSLFNPQLDAQVPVTIASIFAEVAMEGEGGFSSQNHEMFLTCAQILNDVLSNKNVTLGGNPELPAPKTPKRIMTHASIAYQLPETYEEFLRKTTQEISDSDIANIVLPGADESRRTEKTTIRAVFRAFLGNNRSKADWISKIPQRVG